MANDGRKGSLDRDVSHLFTLVSEALAGATDALLAGEPEEASRVVAADESIDELTFQLSRRIWEDFDRLAPASAELRRLVGLLSVLPELERSAESGRAHRPTRRRPSGREYVPGKPRDRPAHVGRRLGDVARGGGGLR